MKLLINNTRKFSSSSSFSVVLLLLLLAIGCNICTIAAEKEVSSEAEAEAGEEPEAPIITRVSYEELTFINFSDKLIELYWVDAEDPNSKEYLAVTARPYELTSTDTFSGHVFSYSWGGARFTHTVAQTNSNYTDNSDGDTDNKEEHTEDDEGEDDEYEDSKIADRQPQIHILGDMDLSDEKLRAEYNKLVAQEMLKPKSETKLVVCGTTEGEIHIKVKPFWSPRGAARFLELVSKQNRYYDGCALNRVVPKFLTQFGIGAKFEQRSSYRENIILDDIPSDPKIPFEPGYMSYAGSGEDSRSTEVFIVMPDTPQSQLDYFGENAWETPFGYVEPKDLSVVAKWHDSYGDMAPWGNGPDPQKIYEEDGYDYLRKDFPDMSYIRGCVIIADDDMNDEDDPLMRKNYDELADEEEL